MSTTTNAGGAVQHGSESVAGAAKADKAAEREAAKAARKADLEVLRGQTNSEFVAGLGMSDETATAYTERFSNLVVRLIQFVGQALLEAVAIGNDALELITLHKSDLETSARRANPTLPENYSPWQSGDTTRQCEKLAQNVAYATGKKISGKKIAEFLRVAILYREIVATFPELRASLDRLPFSVFANWFVPNALIWDADKLSGTLDGQWADFVKEWLPRSAEANERMDLREQLSAAAKARAAAIAFKDLTPAQIAQKEHEALAKEAQREHTSAINGVGKSVLAALSTASVKPHEIVGPMVRQFDALGLNFAESLAKGLLVSGDFATVQATVKALQKVIAVVANLDSTIGSDTAAA